VIAASHYVTQADANAQDDAAVVGNSRSSPPPHLLQLDRTGDRIHCTGELDPYSVAHHLDYAAVMRGHQMFARRTMSAASVPASSCSIGAAVADHISGQKNAAT
jgi:hypothetical protein